MASTAGIAPATSTFARWRSDLSELRGQLALGHLASVIGLAPIRPDLKGRLLREFATRKRVFENRRMNPLSFAGFLSITRPWKPRGATNLFTKWCSTPDAG